MPSRPRQSWQSAPSDGRQATGAVSVSFTEGCGSDTITLFVAQCIERCQVVWPRFEYIGRTVWRTFGCSHTVSPLGQMSGCSFSQIDVGVGTARTVTVKRTTGHPSSRPYRIWRRASHDGRMNRRSCFPELERRSRLRHCYVVCCTIHKEKPDRLAHIRVKRANNMADI